MAGAAGEARASGHQAGTVSPWLSDHQVQGLLSHALESPGLQEEQQGARKQRRPGVAVPYRRGGVGAPWEPVGGVLVSLSSSGRAGALSQP